MNKQKLREAAVSLEQEAGRAIAAGYSNAKCVLTGEIGRLLPLAKAELIEQPIKLQSKAGLHRFLSETELGKCVALEAALNEFVWFIEDYDSKPEIIADKARNPGGYKY